jgi:YbgC/YbaW family acyl-CoA thioester hydrolase
VRRGAIGKVVPGYTAKVVDDTGEEVPRGTIGKLAVVGPTGCRYLDDARQGNYVKDGWNYPGDAFMQDADGYFFYQARADDMIITAGYNVAGPEVEDALLKHPAVAECGVVGLPDDDRGMIVKAFVVLKPGEAGGDTLAKAAAGPRQGHAGAVQVSAPDRVRGQAAAHRDRQAATLQAAPVMKFTVQKQVRFHHCDPAGIVFYPQFFYLLHEVQEDFLAHIGFPEHKLIAGGTGVPIVDLKTEFLGMCRNGDQLTMTLELTRIGGSSMGMQYEIHGDAGKTIRLRAHGVVVYSEVPHGKPVRIPDEHAQRLMPYLQTPLETHVQETTTTRLGRTQGLCQRHPGARRAAVCGRPDRLEREAAV